MKTIIIAIIMLVSICEASATDKPGWWRRTFCELTWEEAALVRETPKSISTAVRYRVDYQDDLGDVWQSGKETWEKATGDCEDFATAVVELCKNRGLDARIVILCPKGSSEAHAVAVGTYNGKLWMSSNGWYQEFKSIEKAKDEVARDIGWRKKQVAILELSPATDALQHMTTATDTREVITQ